MKRTPVIYALRAVGSSRVKIGTSVSFRGRCRTLRRQAGVPLALESLIAGDCRVERGLHRLFSDYSVIGEWFRVPPKLVQAVFERMETDRRFRERIVAIATLRFHRFQHFIENGLRGERILDAMIGDSFGRLFSRWKRMKDRGGRPRMPPEKKRRMFPLKLRPDELRIIQRAARLSGMKVGTWIRTVAMRAAGGLK